MQQRYASFRAFYPFYLSQHRNPRCRYWHYAGSTLALLTLFGGLLYGTWLALPAALLAGYGCAWIGHFGYEHNRPATFIYPIYSLMGDWVMLYQAITRQLPQHENWPRDLPAFLPTVPSASSPKAPQ